MKVTRRSTNSVSLGALIKRQLKHGPNTGPRVHSDMEILSAVIRKYRWFLWKSLGCCKIVIDGDYRLKCVAIDDGSRIAAKDIFQKLSELKQVEIEL